MEKIKYELPDYNTNPDIPRELDKLVNALDQQVMTSDDKDAMEINFQEQLEDMRTYITTLSESNAIPTLYQLSTELTYYSYQLNNAEETIDDLEIASIYDFVGRPIEQTITDDIGKYVQVGEYCFMITGIVDVFSYSIVYASAPYAHSILIYDKTKLRDFSFIKSTVSEEPVYDDFEEDLSFVLFKNDFGTVKIGIYAKIKSTSTLTPLIELDDYVEIPLFSVFYSTIEKIFKMWDGNDFVDFGQTFIPQAETYTKDEIDEITGLNSTQISKREYVFQSGSNVYIDRTESENPVLNVLNFDAMDKTKDAITSLTARKVEDIKGYQVILNTLSSAESGGFRFNLPDISNDKINDDIKTIEERVNGFDEMLTELKKSIEDTGWITLKYTNSIFRNHTPSRDLMIKKIGKSVIIDGIACCDIAGTIDLSPIQFSEVPEGMRPSREVFQICQGSGRDRWFLTVRPDGSITADRYGPGKQPANVWLPFSITYLID